MSFPQTLGMQLLIRTWFKSLSFSVLQLLHAQSSCNTSNVNGRDRGPKQKLASGWLQSAVTKTDILFVIIECKGRHSFRHRV